MHQCTNCEGTLDSGRYVRCVVWVGTVTIFNPGNRSQVYPRRVDDWGRSIFGWLPGDRCTMILVPSREASNGEFPEKENPALCIVRTVRVLLLVPLLVLYA